MVKTIELLVKECQKLEIHKHYCDNGYGSMPKVCKYNGDVIHVPVYKDGHRGYSIRYECKLFKK